MKYPLKRLKLSTGIYFNIISDKKFKTNRISINLIFPLKEETVSASAIIPFILKKRFKDIPDFTKLNQKLDDLYGSVLDGDVRKFGDYQILNLYISGIDNKYALKSEDIVSEITNIIGKVLLDPVLEDGHFLDKDVEIEKNMLVDTIESEINDKQSYALNKLEKIMFSSRPCGINKYGFIDNVKRLKSSDIFNRYKEILKSARIEIMFIGSGDGNKSFDIFKDIFSKIDREESFSILMPAQQKSDDIKSLVEEMKINQSKMVLGFTSGVSAKSKELDALRIGVAIYGGMPFSKLFLNVRESLSLCYYCSSRLDKLTGSIIVESGVEKANIEKAKQEILNQLFEVQSGKFTEEDLSNSKLALITSFKSISDSPGMLEVWYLTQIFSESESTPLMDCEKISKITKQEVVEVFSKVNLDTVYILTNK